MRNRWVLFLICGAAWAADCTRTSVMLPPLSDPFQDGLYSTSGGIPAPHLAAGLSLASQIRPITGKIVLLSVGMSNTTQEFSLFQQLAGQDPEKNPDLVIVDGAQGGWSADRLVAGGDEYWAEVDRRLQAAGVSGEQVQAAWMKQADAQPSLRYPADARKLQGELETIARTLRSRFPNLKLLYLSSRIYGGYASTALNPEPFAYQSAYAVRWAIARQMEGAPELSYTAGAAPWMAWGPYLWADGTRERFDGLTWACADFAADGTHPSAAGARKVALMLLDFLKSDPTARPWFVRAPAQTPPKPVILAAANASSYARAITPGTLVSLFGDNLAPDNAVAGGLPLPTVLAGVRVEAGGVPALLYYVSPGQINFVLPAGIGLVDELVVVREGVRSDVFHARISTGMPGLFSIDGSGSGPAAAQHTDGRTITPANPARPGETIQMYGTGKGLRDPRIMAPEPIALVSFGGVLKTPQYFGPAPGFPGLEQINVAIPEDVPAADATKVYVQVGDTVSNEVVLAIRSGT